MEFGNIIKKHRKNKGFSQEKLASCCNISQKELSQIESNQLIPTFRTLHVMTRKFHITLLDLAKELLNEPGLSENKRNILILFFESLI